jgi:gamma-glutamylcyclotransferase (GGCT)/AIG2-like uncharacterized protein YtfP
MTRLFVYGTLAPGGGAWELLAPWTTGVTWPDAAPGALYDTGRGYPAATFSADAPGLVHGVIVELDPTRAAAALAGLDRYEGDEYTRMSVRTRSGIDATTYAWTAPLDGCVALADGRWAAG